MQRKKLALALPIIISMSPPGYPSAWLHPRIARLSFTWQADGSREGDIDWSASNRRVIRDPASAIARSPADHPPGFSYGTTKLTEVPQFAKPSLVPPQVPSVRVNSGSRQFGNWM